VFGQSKPWQVRTPETAAVALSLRKGHSHQIIIFSHDPHHQVTTLDLVQALRLKPCACSPKDRIQL
jgi:hypothetical protein